MEVPSGGAGGAGGAGASPFLEACSGLLVSDSTDREETVMSLAHFPAALLDDFRLALEDARSQGDKKKGEHPLYYVLAMAEDHTTEELGCMRAVIEHTIGERWHTVMGAAGLIIRSTERSEALIKMTFQLLERVLDKQVPPERFPPIDRVPIRGIGWFSYEGAASGSKDPGLFATWVAAVDEISDEHKERCPR